MYSIVIIHLVAILVHTCILLNDGLHVTKPHRFVQTFFAGFVPVLNIIVILRYFS